MKVKVYRLSALLVKGKLAEYVRKTVDVVTKTPSAKPVKSSVILPKMKLKSLSSDVVEISSGSIPFKISDNLVARTTSEQRKLLEYLYKEQFIKLSKNKILHPYSPILDKGSLLHGEVYDSKVIDSILKDGLISIDLGKVLRKTPNSQTTIGGIDTWVNDKMRSVDEYFNKWLAQPPEYANTPFKKLNRQLCWRGENKWIDLSDKCGKKIVFVVNPTKHKELQEITKYSVTPATKGLRTTAFGGDMTNQKGNCMYETPDFERHTFIPVGIPSNYFEKIVVGKKITPEQVTEIKNMIKKYGLDVKVCDTSGKLL